MTKVVNIHTRAPYDIYIGRRRNGDPNQHYGNPFSHLSSGLAKVHVSSREEAVAAYRAWLNGDKYQDIEPARRTWILSNLDRLRGKTLGCFCAPKACHGDVLARLVDTC
jgi:hypothetical protein